MIKIKIILMSALVIATVGGALAFKASKKSPEWFCGTTKDSCPFMDYLHHYTTVGANEINRVNGIYCTNWLQEGDCTYVTLEP